MLSLVVLLIGFLSVAAPISGSLIPEERLESSYYLESSTVTEINRANGTIDTAGRKMLYWLQISDIHINNQSADRNAAFDDFCNTTISTINPAFVLSSGDNLDGMTEQEDHQHYQDKWEYQYFNQTLDKYNLNSDFWFPIVGNHEKYNTGLNMSLYHKYMRNESQYAFDYVTSFGKYRFVMADTTQEYGLSNNYCFFGEMKQGKLDHLEGLLNYGNMDELNHTIISAHHPANIVSSEKSTSGKSFEKLIADSYSPAYLCGHIHIEGLYANNGHTNTLHCPAFREYRMYRICSYDNDIFSFTEQVHDKWPAIHISNPIDSQYYTNSMDLERMLTDNEIRVLIFDPAAHTEINTEVFVDGSSKGALSYQGDNLWSISWNPNDHNDGESHTIRVVSTSPSGTSEQEVEINLTGFQRTPIKSLIGLAVALPYISILRGLFVILFIASLGRLIIPKIYYTANKKKFRGRTPAYYDEPERTFFQKHYAKRWFTSAILPAKITIPLLAMIAYSLIGPYMIGPFNMDIMGSLWPGRMLIDGEYVLTIYSILYPAIFLGAVLSLEFTVFRNYRNKAGVMSWLTWWIYFIMAGAAPFIVLRYFGLGYMFLNPAFYIMLLPGLWIAFVLFRSQKNLKH
mgnify:CR=1 FL=1